MRAELERETTSVFGVTPENKFCLTCQQKKRNGDCEEFKAYVKQERSKEQKTVNKRKRASYKER